jgi:hypothetical protein
MPAYQVELGGRKYRVDAANEEELQAAVSQLEDEHADEKSAATLKTNPATRGWFADTVAGALRGPLKAVEAAADALPDFIPDGRINIGNGRDFIEGPGGTLSDLVAGKPKTSIQQGIEDIGAPQTTVGGLAEGVSQFMTGFLVTRRIAAGAKILQYGGRAADAVNATLQGAVTSGVFFDGQEANLGNLVQMVPALQNPVTEFLATDENTPEAEGRLKNALADAVGGTLVEGVFAVAKAAKAGRAVRRETEQGVADAAPAPEVAPTPAPEAAPKADLTLAPDEPLPVTPPHYDPLAHEAMMARADALKLEGDNVGAAEVAADAVAQKAEAVAAQATQAGAPPPTRMAERQPSDLMASLRKRFGLTDEKLAEIDKAIQAGVPPQEVEKLLEFNPKNIDWETIRTPEDVSALLDTIANITGDASRRAAGIGRVSIEKTVKRGAKLIDELGGGYDAAVRLATKFENNAAAMDVLRKFVVTSADHLSGLAKKILGGDYAPEDLVKLVEHEARHTVLQLQVRGAVAETGRALRIMQNGAKVIDAAASKTRAANLRAARQAKEVAARAAKAADRVKAAEAKRAEAAAAKEAAAQAEKTRMATEEELAKWSAMKHDERMASEVKKAKAAQKDAVKKAKAAEKEAKAKAEAAQREADQLVKANEKAFGGDPRALDVNLEGPVKMQMADVNEALKAMGLRPEDVIEKARKIAAAKDLEDLNRIPRLSIIDKAKDALSTLYINNILSGLPTLAVNVYSGFAKIVESSVEQFGAAALATLRGGDKWERVAAQKSILATWTSWRGAWSMAGKAWKEGLPQVDLLARHEVYKRDGGIPVGNAVQQVLSAPSRAIVTIDEFFKHIFYQQEITARAVEVAASAARLHGEGKAADRMFERVLKDTLENPPDDLVFDAIEKARYQTFQNNPENALVNGLINLSNKSMAVRLILPFIKTPYNIVAQAAERSPLGLLQKQVRDKLMGRMGARAQGEVATRIFLGTSAIGMVWQLADENRITGSKVGGKGLRNTADMEAPPYSVKIGDTWYQYSRVDPIGTTLGLAADLRLYFNNRSARLANQTTLDDPESTEAMSAIMGMFVENLADKAFFKGVSDFFEAMGSVKDGGSGAFLNTYANNMALNFVPYSSMQRNIAKAADEYSREAWTLMDKLRAQTPGFSESLPPRRDILGREVRNPDRLGPEWMSPIALGKDDPDPVAQALIKLELPYRMPDKDIAGVPMNEAQYSRMLEVRGKFIYDIVDETMKTGEWDTMSRFQKTDYLRKVFTAATTVAEGTLMDENPELLTLVQALRTEQGAVKAGEIQ